MTQGINIINYYLNSFELLISKSSVEDLFITQRLYLGFFIVISAILLFNIYQTSINNVQKYPSLLLIIYFLFVLFLISSRSALLIAVVVFLTTIIYEIKPLQSFLLVVGVGLIFSSIIYTCLLYTSPSPRDATLSRMPSSA